MRFFRFHRRHGLAGLLVLGLGVAAVGCHRYRTPEDRVAHAKEWVQDELELSAEQTTKLDKLGDAALAAMKDMKAQRDADFASVLAQVEGTMDRDALGALVNQRLDGVKDKAPEVLDRLVEFQASLNPEQKAQVAKWLRRLHERRGQK